MDNPFANEAYGKIALKKMGKEFEENFRLYEVGWLETGGHPCTWDVMEVKGALFREALRGPRKGQLCIQIPGTKQVAYVTKAEMVAYEKKHTPEYRVEINHCNCHPETCGCNPYMIVDREGNKMTTAYTREQADKVLEILNK